MSKRPPNRDLPEGEKTAVPVPKSPAEKPAPRDDDELYEQGDIATPKRDLPYEDGL